MLGIKDDLLARRLQKLHRIGDHGQVFILGGMKHLLDLVDPTLTENGDHRNITFSNGTQCCIVAGTLTCAAGAAKSHQTGIFKTFAQFLGPMKNIPIIGAQSKIPCLDIGYAKIIQSVNHPKAVCFGEGDPRSLCTVTQGGIENLYLHLSSPLKVR